MTPQYAFSERAKALLTYLGQFKRAKRPLPVQTLHIAFGMHPVNGSLGNFPPPRLPKGGFSPIEEKVHHVYATRRLALGRHRVTVHGYALHIAGPISQRECLPVRHLTLGAGMCYLTQACFARPRRASFDP